MKKISLLFLTLLVGLSSFAQTKIRMRSADKAECVKSDMTSLKATFTFSGLEATELKSDRGVFSTVTMPNTVIGGNEGDPQIPVVNQLIAVPVGSKPSIRVTNYTTTDYRLEDYGIHQLSPRQPDLFKNQDPKDAPFIYNEAAYQRRGLRTEPLARVSVNGTLRGVQIGQFTIEPVSYDPVSNTLRVFNNLEVEVSFDGADAKATEDLLVKTYSPYFDILYKQLFNGRAVLDLYDEHPDLYTTPVKMLVIANRMFESCIQDWVAWKTVKGIRVDVNYTDDIGTSADAIKTFIQNKYAQDAPTFLMIMGDQDQVAPSVTSASNTSRVSDLYYSSVDGDEFVDMYHSRLSATSAAEMTAILNKGMEYEQYTMPDPSYLNNVLLIAGEDSGWGVTVGRPTIWYATNYYYNTEHGFSNVHEFSHGDYTNCYNPLSSGVGFANYTAHGSQTSWAGPSFSVSDVANLTNTHKYFLAIGNCCQSGDWGYSTCFGEAMTRAENKGAYAYIGSCPNTTWKNDYYFGVGPTNRADGTMPSYEETGMGIYDAIWMDDVYNTVNSILYVGLLAGNAAGALGYELHSETLYYWQAYHVLGDGSIMPYRVQPTANQVSHMSIFPIGMPYYEVSALPGSYVAISKDGVLLGAALVDDAGTVNVPITPVTSSGNVTICVTAPQRIPYIQTVPATALEGPYIAVDSYTPNAAHVGDNTDLSITFKNVGTTATSGTTTVTLSAPDTDAVNIISGTKTFGSLAADATTTVSGFRYKIANGVPDGTKVTIHYTAVNDGETYEGNIVITANEAVLEYQGMTWDGGFVPGETITVTAKFKNTGHYQATNAVAKMTSSSSYVTVSNPNVTLGSIAVDQVVSCEFHVTVAANCPETAQLPVTFTLNANGGLTAQGSETLKNACNVVFHLADSYGDGWNGNVLNVSFDDGTPTQNLTFSSGGSADFTLEIGNGVQVTLSWTSGSYSSECSFTVSYEGNLPIYQSSGTPSDGTLYTFVCNCAAALMTYDVTVASAGHGTVSGGGTGLSYGQSCTVTATPDEGYMFTSWTNNGTVVSSASSYTFNVTGNMNLVAHFDQGSQIGSGGATSQYLPSWNYYKYSLTQQIYTSAELGEAGNITSIAFYNAGAAKTRTYDFYLKATSKTSFTSGTDWVTVSNSDKVFSGSVNMVAGEWTFIIFDKPFEYDGTSNLVLVADDNTGSYTSSPHMQCLVFNASNQAIYIYNDGTNYDPFNPSSYSGNVLSTKNQLQLTKESIGPVFHDITVSAEPADGGTVSGGGNYEQGTSVTLTATPATGYTFSKWTKNGTQMSTNASYTITVTEEATYVAHFILNSYAVDATADPAEGGTITGTGTYNHGATCTLTAAPAADYQFVEWTENGILLSTDNSVTFTVESGHTLVAHFVQLTHQVQSFSTGWGWTSFYVNLSGAEGLAAVEEALGSNGNLIKNMDEFVTYTEGTWYGTLQSIDVERMYQIKASCNGTFSLTAEAVQPEDHPITLVNGWNWIGYPCTTENDAAAALSEFQATNEDIMKSYDAMITYIEGYGWWGTLGKLTPGTGYMYKSNNAANQTLTYCQGSKRQVHLSDNSNLHWTANAAGHRDNANLMVTVNSDDIVLSEDVEIGAFVNGECRGTAKLMYVEPFDNYVAFMTVYGDDNEEIRFMIHHQGETYQTDEHVVYSDNMVVGKPSEPFLLHTSASGGLVLYPNPVEKGKEITFELPNTIDIASARVEIFNSFGSLVRVQAFEPSLTGIMTSGVYTLRVTDAKGQTCYGKLVVK